MSDWADVGTSLRGFGATKGIATAASSSNTVAVDVGGQVVTVATVRGLAVAAGDPVLLQRVGSTWYATALLAAAAVDLTTLANDAAPDVRPTFRAGQLIFKPTDTATYRASVGWRTDTTDLFQGDQSGTGRLTGCAFYGDQLAALAGATVTRAVVKLKRLSAGPWAAAAPTLKLVTEAARPAGAPTLSSSLAGPSLRPDAESDLDIGTTWGQGLVNGTYGGLAVNVAADTPYLRLAGRDSWAAGMTVVIDWRREG